jgi:hypothetical protein
MPRHVNGIASWLIEMFRKMGDDPSIADYVVPGSDDVWAFMSRIRRWLMDKDRKGIPG